MKERRQRKTEAFDERKERKNTGATGRSELADEGPRMKKDV